MFILYNLSMSNKKYYPKRYTKKRIISNVKKFLTNVLVFLLITLSSVLIFFLYVYVKSLNFYSILAIKDFLVVENETTIPSELIVKKLLEEKSTIFNLNKVKNKILKIFPEIKNIEFKFRSFKTYYVKVRKENPVFLIKEDKKITFYTSEGKKFWFYDISRGSFNVIIELSYEDPVEKNFLVSFYDYISNIEKNNLIKKVYFKQNKEIIIETFSGNKIIVDRSLTNVNPELFIHSFEILEKESLDIYARDLEAGKLYVKHSKAN